MAFCRSSLLVRKSFLTNALDKCALYPSLFQLSLASILFSIFLVSLHCCKVVKAQPFHCNFENVSKLIKDAKQLAVIVYFLSENVKKVGFFQILSPQSVFLVPSYPSMKSGNTSQIN